MDIKEIIAKRIALEFEIGGRIMQFEDETGLEVGPTVAYDRLYSEEGWDDTRPVAQVRVEVPYCLMDDGEEEEVSAATS